MTEALKTFVKVFIMICLATVVAGFTYAHYKATHQYELLVFHEHLRQGDTIDDIAAHYYNPAMESRSWAEFRYDVAQRNKVHFANGRVPQVGDIICIEVYQRVQR